MGGNGTSLQKLSGTGPPMKAQLPLRVAVPWPHAAEQALHSPICQLDPLHTSLAQGRLRSYGARHAHVVGTMQQDHCRQ